MLYFTFVTLCKVTKDSESVSSSVKWGQFVWNHTTVLDTVLDIMSYQLKI